MTKTIKQLNIHYYVSIIVLAILFLLVLFKLIGFAEISPSVGVVVERYVIGITLIAIPVALKLFADNVKKIPKGGDKNVAIRLYKKAFYIRLYIIHSVTLLNIVLFAVSRNNNFMWLAVVLFVVFVFCKPSLSELENITEAEE